MRVYVSAGAEELYGGLVRETTGKDISASTFKIGLGTSSTPPTEWSTPDVSEQGASPAERVVKMLITNTVQLGRYYGWIWITDDPEQIPERIPDQLTVL